MMLNTEIVINSSCNLILHYFNKYVSLFTGSVINIHVADVFKIVFIDKTKINSGIG